MEGDNREPELITTFQDQHDHISTPNTQRLEIGSGLVGISFHIGKGEIDVFTMVVRPAERTLLWLLSRPCVYHIVTKVEILGHLNPQILFEILR